MLSTKEDSYCTYTFLVLYVLSGTRGCELPLFPFLPEWPMRGPVKKSKSVGAFKKRVGLTDKVNLMRNRRGGIRL